MKRSRDSGDFSQRSSRPAPLRESFPPKAHEDLESPKTLSVPFSNSKIAETNSVDISDAEIPAKWALERKDILVCRRLAGPDLFNSIMELRYKKYVDTNAVDVNMKASSEKDIHSASKDNTLDDLLDYMEGDKRGSSVGGGEKMRGVEDGKDLADNEDASPLNDDDDDLYGDMNDDDDDMYGDIGEDTNEIAQETVPGVGGVNDEPGAVHDSDSEEDEDAVGDSKEGETAVAAPVCMKAKRKAFVELMYHRLTQSKQEFPHKPATVMPYLLQSVSAARLGCYGRSIRGSDFVSTFLQSYQVNSRLFTPTEKFAANE